MSKMICFDYKFCCIYSMFSKYREEESEHSPCCYYMLLPLSLLFFITMRNVDVQLKLMSVAPWLQGDRPLAGAFLQVSAFKIHFFYFSGPVRGSKDRESHNCPEWQRTKRMWNDLFSFFIFCGARVRFRGASCGEFTSFPHVCVGSLHT